MPDGIFFSNKAQYAENQALSGGQCYSAIWLDSREHSKNVFAVNLGHRDNVHEF